MIEQHKPSATVAPLHRLEVPPEEPIDVGRYANALRRSKLLIASIVVVVTGLVLLMSLALPKTYSAKATMVFNEDPTITTTTDAERQLATIQKLLVTRDVLATSAKRLPGESVTSLAGNVVASVDPTANIVTITASGSSPERAARTANVVAAAFLARERAADIARIQSAENRLNAAIVGLKGTPGGAAQIALIRERLSELSVSAATAGSELQLADPAHPPATPTSPRPLRNAGFAFVAALFIAMLVALGRERIAPRIGEPRELERLTGYPILSEMPESRRFFRDPQAALREREAHEALAAVVAAQLPPQRRQILLLTSPAADEAKARVTAGLSRALAQAGETALVIDADLRRPALEQLFGMESAPRARRAPGRRAAGRQRGSGRDDRRASPFGLAAANRKPGGARRGGGSFTRARDRGRAEDSVRRARPDELLVRDPQRPADPRLSGVAGLGAPRRRARRRLAAGQLHPSDAVELRNQLDLVGTPVLGHVVVGGT